MLEIAQKRKSAKIVVDDISSSGYSLQVVERFAYDNGCQVVRTAVLVYKPLKCIVQPNFFAEQCDEDVWHTYPWAIAEDLSHIASQDPHIGLLYAAKQHSEIQQYLVHPGRSLSPDSIAV